MTIGPGFRIGDFDVVTIADADCFEIDMSRIFPSSDRDALRGHSWLEPHSVDLASNRLKLGMHSFLIRAGTLNILVDTCIGEHKDRLANPFWHQRTNSTFLGDLRAHGLSPEDIDLVFCTHLHADHVGWNTWLDNGRWVPTFPRARYAVGADELGYWQAAQAASGTLVNHGAYQDSVLPIVEGGQALLVNPGDELATGIALVALFGHTPGHLGLDVKRGADRALFCGDAIHSPVQLVHPQWHSAFCSDAGQAVATRIGMLARAAAADIILCPAHFRGARAMRIKSTGSGFEPR